MRVVLLVLHIMFAIMFGIFSVVNTDKIFATLHMIVSISQSVCIGMDIAWLVLDGKDKK